jgi:plasmid stability protein
MRRLLEWVQIAPTAPYDEEVSRVIQIRDVPDDVHEELRAAAEARGQSLTRYALAALEDAVRRQRSVAHNAEVIRRAKAEIGADVSREAILEALRDVRGE